MVSLFVKTYFKTDCKICFLGGMGAMSDTSKRFEIRVSRPTLNQNFDRHSREHTTHCIDRGVYKRSAFGIT